VYIPNLDGGERLLTALASLRQQTHAVDVVVVDNDSRDGSAGVAKRAFPEITLIELGTNVGFGRALNAAVRQVPGDPLIFLNNDVECAPEFVAAMLDEAASGTEMVAGVLLQHSAPHLIDSAGVIIDAGLMPFDYLHGRPVEDAIVAAPPLGPTGAAALIRLAPFNAVAGFDERIFAYFEDADLALRLRERGASCSLAADARVTHHYSATLGTGAPRKYQLTGWSRGYLMRRYGVLRRPGRALRALVLESALCAGQLVVDRTDSGARGRISGWRAAGGLPRRPFPREGVLELSIMEALSLRAGRRELKMPRFRGARARW